MGDAEQRLTALIDRLTGLVERLLRAGHASGDDLLSTRTCGAEVDHSHAWVMRRIWDGRLRAVQVEGVLRVKRSEWQRFLASVTEDYRPKEGAA